MTARGVVGAALGLRQLVQGCRRLRNLARRISCIIHQGLVHIFNYVQYFDVGQKETRAREATATPIFTASTHPERPRHLQKPVATTAPCLGINPNPIQSTHSSLLLKLLWQPEQPLRDRYNSTDLWGSFPAYGAGGSTALWTGMHRPMWLIMCPI